MLDLEWGLYSPISHIRPINGFDCMAPYFTEAAQRVLETAARLATQQQAPNVAPDHVFAALLSEEGRASEVLFQHGFSPNSAEMDQEASGTEHDHHDTDAPQYNCQLESLLHDAVYLKNLGNHHSETGTEHLLWALARLTGPLSAELAERGIDERLLEELYGETLNSERPPIEVDLSSADIISIPAEPTRLREADPPHVFRILDAAANRAREGLRVIEDYVRFCLDNVELTTQIKNCRHRVSHTVDALGSHQLLSSRDTTHDIGTTITTPTETTRNSLQDVVKANLKRVQESVRTLEEYTKTLDKQASAVFEQTRYQMYDLEQQLLTCAVAIPPLANHHLYLLLTESVCRTEWSVVAEQALAAGVRVIQMREKAKSDRQLIEMGRRLRAQTHEHGALLIVNDRADVAAAVDADGVHVGQDELQIADARKIVGPNRLVGVSTHSLEQATAAVDQGADYIGVGPVFPSTTKEFPDFVGLELVRTVSQHIEIPWYAIGGISSQNLPQVLEAGASGAAVTAAICGAEDVPQSTQELLSLLDGA